MLKIHHIGFISRIKIKLADWRMRRGDKAFYLVGGLGGGLLLLGLVGFGWVVLGRPVVKPVARLSPVPSLALGDLSEPRDEVALLDGVKLTKGEFTRLSQRRPLAIMVENHPDARPQSGLEQAELVWEALVEGGITRFMPVYWRNDPEVVGPVRSARKYYLDWVSELGDALYMHIGGAVSANPQANALLYIQQNGLKSLGVNGRNTFWRVSDRFAPHNAYSNTRQLWQEAKRIGWVGSQSMGVWQFKDDAPASQRGSTKEIVVNWDGWGQTLWSVRWVFDPQANSYKRYHNLTEPHLDAVSKQQLRAKNVVVAFMSVSLANDGTARVVYDNLGSGRALVFRDGRVIEGEWRKSSRTDRTRFYDQEGEEISFNRGKTWIMAVPINSEIKY